MSALKQLVDAWAQAKQAEDDAARRRVEIEALIVAATGERTEGSASHALADGRTLVVTSKITRTVDEDAWRAIADQVPEPLRPVSFVETARLDLKGLRWLQDHEPALYAIVAQAITAKRAKTSITIKG